MGQAGDLRSLTWIGSGDPPTTRGDPPTTKFSRRYEHRAIQTGGSETVVETNAGGIARICLIYNQDKANWVQLDMTATAGVSGTESSKTVQPVIPGLAADYTAITEDPPGRFSPYGELPGCDNPD